MAGSSASVFVTWLLCVISLQVGGSYGFRGRQCKAIPNTLAWPSDEAWAKLNTSTGGRLLHPTPPGAVCHPNQPTYNPAACSTVQSEWPAYPFHDDNPISVGANEFTEDSCLPNATFPCSSKGYPVYVINATTAEHAKLGVDFAREHSIRLVVKASGHDYIGRSVAPYSLSIWMRYMGGTTLHNDSFVPKDCQAYDGPAVTAKGGTHMGELVNATALVDRTVVTGGSPTVSIGGYLTGGGHGVLSPRYGLAADQVLEMEVVTPAGAIATANACQNQDLFWAMRGGGGSTFGVLTSVTVKTFPTPPIVFLDLLLGTPNYTDPSIWEVYTYLLTQYPRLGDLGLSGYSFIVPETPFALDGEDVTVAGYETVFILQDTQDPADMQKIWDPILDHINATWPGWFAFPTIQTYPTFLAWYNENHDLDLEAGTDALVGSRLLDAKALTADASETIPIWKQFTAAGESNAYIVSGKGVWDAQIAGGSNSVNPAWRKSYVHATNGVSWQPRNSTAKAEAIAELIWSVEALERLAPDSGAYVNEANAYQPHFQEVFWGDNYPRLLKIKRELDPEDVFWCTPCVGNERWHEVDGQLCRI